MIKTIIIPFPHPEQDPEGIARAAVPAAQLLARTTGASVTLACAMDLLPRFDPLARRLISPGQDVRKTLIAEARQALQQIAPAFAGIPVEVDVRWGSPIETILQITEESDDPLIVVASSVRRGLSRALSGSMAFDLAHEATCPVIVIHGRYAAPDMTLSPLHTIVVPLDQSTLAEHALDTIPQIAEAGSATIHLVHVIEPFDAREPHAEHLVDADALNSMRYLEQKAESLRSLGFDVMVETRRGRPSDQIVEAAAEQNAGLIAMATHGRGGLSRIMFGSNAERVLRQVQVPLLLVKPELPQDMGIAVGTGAGQRYQSTSTPPTLWNLTARDIMSSPPIVARQETPVSEIVKTMIHHGIGSVPIVDHRGELVGLVTEADFVASDQCVPITAFQVPYCFDRYMTDDAMRDIRLAGEMTTAESIMRRDVTVATEDEPVSAVAQKLLSPDLRRIPVVRGRIPVGVIAERDLLKLLLPETSTEPGSD